MLLVDDRWSAIPEIGIGRFSREVLKRIPEAVYLDHGLRVLHPLEPVWLSWRIQRARPNAYFTPGFNLPLVSKQNCVFVIFDLVHINGQDECPAWKRAYYSCVVKPACRRAFRILTASEFSKEEILAWSGVDEDRVTVVGAGVDSRFVPIPTGCLYDCPYLLYLGNRRPHKNIPRMLRAFAQSQAAKEAMLLMSGRSDVRTEELIRECGAERRVKFLGNIPEERLPCVISGALALLIPSLREGFGLPALEAMACGTPVIAARAASLPEVVGDAGIQIDPSSVEDIASAINRLFLDARLREELKEKGLARAQRFTWEKTAAAIRRVLHEAGGLSHP